MVKENKLIVFQDKQIRRVWHNDEWFFVIEDVVFALTESKDAKQYIQRLKSRDSILAEGWVQFVHTLLVKTSGGNQRMNCANTKSLFRIIQSIPSKKAEPFKIWLAKVGYERIQEIENPELAQNRAREYYELKGYSKSWIDVRLRGIAVRQSLTEEWGNRDVKKDFEFAILTDEISKATFGINIQDHKKVKGMNPKFKNQNLRDNLTDLELVFNMLGEASTTEIAKTSDAQGFDENKIAAKKGGKIAGNARKNLELETGKGVVSEKNQIHLTEKKKEELE